MVKSLLLLLKFMFSRQTDRGVMTRGDDKKRHMLCLKRRAFVVETTRYFIAAIKIGRFNKNADLPS